MNHAWLLKRLAYLALLVAIPAGIAAATAHAWSPVTEFLNGGWSPWVGNVASALQIGTLIVALAWWLTRTARSRTTAPTEGAAARGRRDGRTEPRPPAHGRLARRRG